MARTRISFASMHHIFLSQSRSPPFCFFFFYFFSSTATTPRRRLHAQNNCNPPMRTFHARSTVTRHVKPLDIAMEEEEWAEEAGGLFAEFAAETTQGKSTRKRNREANEQTAEEREEEQVRQRQSREQTAEAARKRITATIVSRASQKELRSLAKSSKAHRRQGGAPGHGGASNSQASPSESHLDVPRKPRAFKKKGAKLEQKLSRKAERKDEARVNAIKNKKVLRKTGH